MAKIPRIGLLGITQELYDDRGVHGLPSGPG